MIPKCIFPFLLLLGLGNCGEEIEQENAELLAD